MWRYVYDFRFSKMALTTKRSRLLLKYECEAVFAFFFWPFRMSDNAWPMSMSESRVATSTNTDYLFTMRWLTTSIFQVKSIVKSWILKTKIHSTRKIHLSLKRDASPLASISPLITVLILVLQSKYINGIRSIQVHTGTKICRRSSSILTERKKWRPMIMNVSARLDDSSGDDGRA